MGALPYELVRELRYRLELRRAVEGGTYNGGGARLLAELFDEVVSIELAERWHLYAREALADLGNVELLLGDTREHLGPLAAHDVPTLYWLDGHWSGADTAGADDECPLLDELAAIGAGTPGDCLLIDDARLFCAAPPPPHDPAKWPTIAEVFDALRAPRPERHVTVLHDIVIAVPIDAKAIVDEFGRQPPPDPPQPKPPASAAPGGVVGALARRLRRG